MRRFWQSIRWRLQLWHALLLVGVLTAFGVTADLLTRDNRLRQVDEELRYRMAEIVGVMRPTTTKKGAPRGPQPGSRSGLKRPFGDAEAQGPPSFPLQVNFSPSQQELFTEHGRGAFYYVVFDRSGSLVQRSDSAPADVPLPDAGEEARSVKRTRGEWRELLQVNWRGVNVVVGHSIAKDLAELRRLRWLLAGAGGIVLALGLAGGGWLSARAIRPVAEIGATAGRIASGNLTERISLADTESELGELAQVLNRTFDRLEAAFVRQAQFTADASHELRTPVAVVLSQAQTALARERSADEYRESLEACQRAAQRMRALIESLLLLARLDSGQPSDQREPCALDQVVGDAIVSLQPLAEQHQVSIRPQLSTAVCVGDAPQLGQVATNLITNAIYYNRPGGEVRIKTRTEVDSAVLIVSDTGPGIAAEHLPRIFERFYRADKSRARAHGRGGLGLAIVRAIVGEHGGTIEVVSKEGGGTAFTVRLPQRRPATRCDVS